MKKFLKVMSVILLSIITIANVVFFIIGMTNNNQLSKTNEVMKTRSYYNDKDTTLNIETFKENYKITTASEFEKYLKEIEIVHVYNTEISCYKKSIQKTVKYYELATYTFKEKIWANPIIPVGGLPMDKNLLASYRDETKYNNGTFLTGTEFYRPLLIKDNENDLYNIHFDNYGLDYYKFAYPKQLQKENRTIQYKTAETDTYWKTLTDTTNFPSWARAHFAMWSSYTKINDHLYEYIITYKDGSSKTISTDITFTETNNPYYKELELLDYSNISKLEYHFDGSAYYHFEDGFIGFNV